MSQEEHLLASWDGQAVPVAPLPWEHVHTLDAQLPLLVPEQPERY